jgi:outer membrane protein
MADPLRVVRSVRRSTSQRLALCRASGALGALFVALSVASAEPPTPRDGDPPPDAGERPLDVVSALRQGAEPTTADEVAALSVRTGPSVARAKAAASKSAEAASQALVAVYPRLDLEARYNRLEGVDDVMIAGMTLAVPRDRYALEAKLTIPLSDMFLQILPRYRAAKDIAEAQRLSAQAEEQTVALMAREAFYNYARARASLLVAQSSLAQTEAQQRDVESLVSAGSMARVELMRAQAQVASATGALARTEGAVAIARTALRTLLHREGQEDFAITENLSEPLPALREDNDRLLQRAVNNRSELRGLRALLSAHERTIGASNRGKLPKVVVGATYDYAKPNPNVISFEAEPPWSDNWMFFGALSWSPNDFATAGTQAGQAEADRTQTLADIQALTDALRREVTQAAEDFRSAQKAMEAGLVGIRAADESYRVRREQFRAGAAVAIDVIDAESDLRRARLELINAAIDVRIADARLARATEGSPNHSAAQPSGNQP